MKTSGWLKATLVLILWSVIKAESHPIQKIDTEPNKVQVIEYTNQNDAKDVSRKNIKHTRLKRATDVEEKRTDIIVTTVSVSSSVAIDKGNKSRRVKHKSTQRRRLPSRYRKGPRLAAVNSPVLKTSASEQVPVTAIPASLNGANLAYIRQRQEKVRQMQRKNETTIHPFQGALHNKTGNNQNKSDEIVPLARSIAYSSKGNNFQPDIKHKQHKNENTYSHSLVISHVTQIPYHPHNDDHIKNISVTTNIEKQLTDLDDVRHRQTPHEHISKIVPEKTSAEPHNQDHYLSESEHTYNEPERSYGEPEKVWSEPANVYGVPEVFYSEPAKIYSVPAKVYGEPAKVYGEPAKVYGEPAKVYSEPAKNYGVPAKNYGTPSKFYSMPASLYLNEPQKTFLTYDDKNSSTQEDTDHNSTTIDQHLTTTSFQDLDEEPTTLPPHDNLESTTERGKFGYVVEGKKYRKYRVEERTSDGFIVGEYGVVNNDNNQLRGVRYTAEGGTNPRLIYETLLKFLTLH